MKLQIIALSLLGLLLDAPLANAEQHALLIGVSDYQDSRISDLEGPVNDVTALKDVLIRNWQFDSRNITVLLDEQATENAILDAIDALAARTQLGDDIIVYYSGHGTSASDPDLGAYLNLPDGSGAIPAYDFDPDNLQIDILADGANDGLLVGRSEIRPRLQALDDGRNVLVIFDACFSGNAARSVSSPYKPSSRRHIDLSPYLTRNNTDSLVTAAQSESSKQDVGTPRSLWGKKKAAFAYNNIVYFGAAAEDQYAIDLSSAEIRAGLVSTFDGKPHGGFSDSLLRALWSEPNEGHQMSFVRLFNRTVNQFNTWCTACGHTPVSLPSPDSNADLLNRTILNAASIFTRIGDVYDAASEPELQDALIVDIDAMDDMEVAMRNLVSTRDLSADTMVSPDVFFKRDDPHINAYAANGELITQLPASATPRALSRWVAGRQWLKRRLTRDTLNEQGELLVNFRHPLASNKISEGDHINFSVFSSNTARLLAFVMDANSQLSVLYPVNEHERHHTLKPGQSVRIPDADAPVIQVTPPWGTDTVLFYAFPAQSDEMNRLIQRLASLGSIELDHPVLAQLETALDSGDSIYSAASIRIVATPDS